MHLYFYNFINTYINEYKKTCNTEPGIEELIHICHWTTYCHPGSYNIQPSRSQSIARAALGYCSLSDTV